MVSVTLLSMDPATAETDYAVPTDCPPRRAFVEALARTSARPPTGWRVTIEPRANGYGGEVQWRGRARRLDATTCASLVDALALSLSLQVVATPLADDGRISSGPPPAPTPAGPPPPVVTPAGTVSRAIAADEDASWTWQGGVGVGVGVVWGRTPSPRPELAVRASLARSDPGYGLAGALSAFTLSSGELVPEGGSGTARLRLQGARLTLCPVAWRTRRFSALGCLEGEVGRVAARGRRATAERASSLWWAGGAELRGAWRPLSALGLAVGSGLSVPGRRYRIAFAEPSETVYTAAAVGFRASVSVAALFP